MDFDFMVGAIRAYYAPLEFKQKKFGFNLEEWVALNRKAVEVAKTDEEAIGVFKGFLAKFRDSHLSLGFKNWASERSAYDLDFDVLVLGKRTVAHNLYSRAAKAGLKEDDEVLSIDGLTPSAFVEKMGGCEGSGTDSGAWASFVAYSYRDPFCKDLLPGEGAGQIEVLREGQKVAITLPWEIRERASKRLKIELGRIKELDPMWKLQFVPWLVTEKNVSKFAIRELQPSSESLATYKIKAEDVFVSEKPLFRVYGYEWIGKKILLIKIPTFDAESSFGISSEKQLSYLKAVLQTHYRESDRVVLDLQGNPGGVSDLASGLMALFADRPLSTETRLFNADRAWSLSFLDRAQASGTSQDLKLMWVDNSLEVDRAILAGESLTRPLRYKEPVAMNIFNFRKPMLVLTDGRSMSAAELAAMYVQDHKLGKTMGTTTAGAGGNVEMVLKLPNSQGNLSVTRTLTLRIGSEDNPRFIENEGVVPDIPYEPSVEDYRNGFEEFFKAVSDAAVALEEPTAPTQQPN